MTEIVGNVLASRLDSRGYTITCTDHVVEPGHGRRGTHWITDPSGETVRAGYWMDRPEPDMDAARYAAMPRDERAALECWHQVERYNGLAYSFEHHRFGPWLPEDTFPARLRNRFLEVATAHPYLHAGEVWNIFFSWAKHMMSRKQFLGTVRDWFLARRNRVAAE